MQREMQSAAGKKASGPASAENLHMPEVDLQTYCQN